MPSRLLIFAALAAFSGPAAAAGPAPGVEHRFVDQPIQLQATADAMTWDEVLDRVGDGNPTTRLVESEIAVATADIADADLYPNPELGVEFEEGGIGGPLYKPAVAKVTVAQTILTGGKRGHARAAAQQGIRVAEAALDAQEAQVLADAARAYLEVLHQKYLHSLAARALELARWDRELTRMRVKGGDLGDGAIHRMDAAVHIAEAGLERRRNAITEALAEVALVWNGDPAQITDLAGALPLPRPAPHLDALLEAAVEAPVVTLTDRRIDRAEAAGDVSRAARAPDVTVEAGYVAADGLSEHGWILGVSVPIPAFDRSQGEIARASAQLRQSRLERLSVLAGTRAAVLRSHARLTSLHKEWTHLQETVLPASRRAWSTVHDAFAGGELTLLDVAASGAELLAIQEREIAIRVEHALARVALDEALGRVPDFLDPEVTP